MKNTNLAFACLLASLVGFPALSAILTSVNNNDPNLLLRSSETEPARQAPDIKRVRLCPGVSGDLKFPNHGYCIDSRIYIELDEQLVEIKPGRYSKNAVGSSCSFTVLEACGIGGK